MTNTQTRERMNAMTKSGLRRFHNRSAGQLRRRIQLLERQVLYLAKRMEEHGIVLRWPR
jgi:hypothetical protein